MPLLVDWDSAKWLFQWAGPWNPSHTTTLSSSFCYYVGVRKRLVLGTACRTSRLVEEPVILEPGLSRPLILELLRKKQLWVLGAWCCETVVLKWSIGHLSCLEVGCKSRHRIFLTKYQLKSTVWSIIKSYNVILITSIGVVLNFNWLMCLWVTFTNSLDEDLELKWLECEGKC